ncbi:hypothetical protein HHI36_020391 [Cryptolaemus montrouzieri]|uniref:Uncharacterized protein n=1 Tax=Cryptolaemus montrouzieri TaxID=559131 RepID=A0ABD2NA41_9CUCU
MFSKLVVLMVILGVAVARPGYLHGSVLGYAAPPAIAIPTAVSHQSRVDVYSKPIVVATSYAVPTLTHVGVAPLTIGLGHGLHGW